MKFLVVLPWIQNYPAYLDELVLGGHNHEGTTGSFETKLVDCTMRCMARQLHALRKLTMTNLHFIVCCDTPNGWIEVAFV